MGNLSFFAVVAQADAGSPSQGSGTASLLLLVGLGAVFYFFLIRPQRKRVATMRSLHGSLEVGDDVRTVGGLLGTIESIDDDVVMLDVAGTRLRFTRQAIASKVGETDS